MCVYPYSLVIIPAKSNLVATELAVAGAVRRLRIGVVTAASAAGAAALLLRLLVRDCRPVAVAIGLVVDHLLAAVGKQHVVASGRQVAVALLHVPEIVARLVVLHVVLEVVARRLVRLVLVVAAAAVAAGAGVRCTVGGLRLLRRLLVDGGRLRRCSVRLGWLLRLLLLLLGRNVAVLGRNVLVAGRSAVLVGRLLRLAAEAGRCGCAVLVGGLLLLVGRQIVGGWRRLGGHEDERRRADGQTDASDEELMDMMVSV